MTEIRLRTGGDGVRIDVRVNEDEGEMLTDCFLEIVRAIRAEGLKIEGEPVQARVHTPPRG